MCVFLSQPALQCAQKQEERSVGEYKWLYNLELRNVFSVWAWKGHVEWEAKTQDKKWLRVDLIFSFCPFFLKSGVKLTYLSISVFAHSSSVWWATIYCKKLHGFLGGLLVKISKSEKVLKTIPVSASFRFFKIFNKLPLLVLVDLI